MAWYKLIKPWTEHNGKIYDEGCSIGLSDEQAEVFAKEGYIELKNAPKKKSKKIKKEKIEENGGIDNTDD